MNMTSQPRLTAAFSTQNPAMSSSLLPLRRPLFANNLLFCCQSLDSAVHSVLLIGACAPLVESEAAEAAHADPGPTIRARREV